MFCICFIWPTVQGLRAQIDRDMYKRYMQEEIRRTDRLTVYEDSVEDLVIGQSEVSDAPCVSGVYLGMYVHVHLLQYLI